MDSLDPSPRASKRRRTGTYATRRTTLNSIPADQTEDSTRTTQNQEHEGENDTLVAPTATTEGRNENDGSGGLETSVEPQLPVLENQEADDSTNSIPSRRISRKIRTSDRPPHDVNNGGLSKSTANTRKRRSAPETYVGATQHLGRTSDLAEVEDKDGVGEMEDETPTKGIVDAESEGQPRSSGRARRPPQRFSSPQASKEVSGSRKQSSQSVRAKAKPIAASGVDNVGGDVGSPQPKGILTPSRRGRDKRTGPRKSVAFEQDERRIGEQFGFKDIDSSTKPTRKGKATSVAKQMLSDRPGKGEGSDAASRGIAAGHEVEDGDNRDLDNQEEEGSKGEGDAEEDYDETTFDTEPDVTEVLAPPTGSAIQLDVDTQKSFEQLDNINVANIKMDILQRMNNHTLCPISHLQSQYSTLHSLLSATVTAGESNSLLLLGSRGSGKSLLISHAIGDLRRSHHEEFHVVRLNGFFQTDDKLALREIWRQLGREMAVPEAETGEVSSYADTMASLLSLLSHPEEFADPDTMMLDVDDNNDTTTSTVNGRGQLGNRTATSVIFILDEFDLFTTHPRQTLLYNLFDIAQAKKAPIAVIGSSCRMDVVDCLEKRVKSRFSHRWLHIPTAKSFGAFEDTVASILSLPVEGKEAVGLPGVQLEWRTRWNQAIKNRLIHAPIYQALLKKTFYSTKSIPDVLAALYIPIAMLTVSESEEPQVSDQQTSNIPVPGFIKDISSLSSPTSLLELLPHLPTLHLTLLICAARLETIHELSALNFALVHSHYAELLARSRMHRSVLSSLTKGGAVTGAAHRSWGKDTVRAAWEELIQWELLVPLSGLSGGVPGGRLGDEGLGGDGVAARMFRVDVTLDEVAWAVKEKLGNVGIGEVLEKWCKEM
ncbi:hypothetical protein A1O1_03659 [Capronia coronata CBS 617.96]|uniref:Uncharacterized protein n=1 Tax=Capronia coronata CBS 617.96 TaxID=1182541 RepID=W9YMT9_9EURO|nr:uncharacterized protein A1O1_03659 [Capronia coronata CBS 617.96]EXJ90556.1 hypothetical protein A1O1_03659 [Capronia coronata CBS 617.96]